MTDRNDMSNEAPCLHFEAKLLPDLRTKIKKCLIAAICDLKQPCQNIDEKLLSHTETKQQITKYLITHNYGPRLIKASLIKEALFRANL